MKVCGVELQGNEAIICILSLSDSLFEVSPCRVQRLVVADSYDSAQMKAFQFSFVKLMQDYNVDRVIIRQREMRGKFAGSAVGFKLEAALQLSPDLNLRLMSSSQRKESLKAHPLHIPFKETELKQFQEAAFIKAFSYLNNPF